MAVKIKVHIDSDTLNDDFFIERSSFFIGRSDKTDITVKNVILSRKHIEVRIEDNQIKIKDLKTTNGTYLNNKKLTANEWYDIGEHDLISLGEGKINIKFEMLAADENREDILNFERKNPQTQVNSTIGLEKAYPTYDSGSTAAVKIRPSTISTQEKIENVLESIKPLDTLQNVLSNVDDSPVTKFSEIELLEIKKIEIESQVKALKIKEESEGQALRILENAKHEAQKILTEAHEKSVEILDEAEDEVESLRNKAHVECEDKIHTVNLEVESKRDAINLEVQNKIDSANLEIEQKILEAQQRSDETILSAKSEAKELLESANAKIQEERFELERKISDLRSDLDYIRKEKNDSSDRLEKINEDISESLKQKQNLELRAESLRDKISMTEEQLNLVQARKEKVDSEFEFQKEKLDDLKFKVERLESKNVDLEGNKQSLERSVNELKEREIQIHENIERNQERLDKFFEIKEEISKENKKLELSLDQLKLEEQNYRVKIEELNKSILDKTQELTSIEERVQNHFQNEQQKYFELLRVQKEKEDESFKKILAENKTTAAKIISDSEKKAHDIEIKANDLFSQAKLKEKEANDFSKQVKEESEKKVEKLNNELAKKSQDAHQEIKAIQEKALHEYQNTLVTAKDKAQDIIHLAQKNADEKIENAQKEAKEMHETSRGELQKAQEKATELVRLAQEKSSQIHADAIKELENSKAKLVKEIEMLKGGVLKLQEQKNHLASEVQSFSSTIKERTKKLEEDLLEQQQNMINMAKKEAEETKRNAYVELERVKSEIKDLEQNQLDEVDKAIKAKQKEEKEKFELELKKEKELIIQLKAAETAKIQSLQKEEEQKVQVRKEKYLETMTNGILNVLNGHIKDLIKKKVIASDYQLDEKNIRNLIKAALIDDNPEHNQLLKKLKASGGKAVGRSAEKTKKMIIGASVAVFVLILGIIFQDSISNMFKSAKDAVAIDKSAKDIYLEEQLERERNKPKFTPTLTDSYKKSYTDNVIYSKRFMEIFTSDDFQKKWVVELTDIMTRKLDLTDYKVVGYISEELKMVQALIDLRLKIRLETVDVRTLEMREVEETSVAKLKKIIGSEEKYQQLQTLTKEFFVRYRNSHPASK